MLVWALRLLNIRSTDIKGNKSPPPLLLPLPQAAAYVWIVFVGGDGGDCLVRISKEEGMYKQRLKGGHL